jgi:hypothetical protein
MVRGRTAGKLDERAARRSLRLDEREEIAVDAIHMRDWERVSGVLVHDHSRWALTNCSVPLRIRSAMSRRS